VPEQLFAPPAKYSRALSYTDHPGEVSAKAFRLPARAPAEGIAPNRKKIYRLYRAEELKSQ